MAKPDFTQSIKNDYNTKDQNENKDNIQNDKPVFVLAKKTNEKANTKAFNVVMDENLVRELDKIAKKSGYSRNELINKMCQFCIGNIEIVEGR